MQLKMNSFKVKSWIVLVFSFFYSFTTLGQTSVPAVSAPVAVRDLASATSSAGNSKNSNGNSQNIWAVPLNDKVIIHAAGSVVIHYKEKSRTQISTAYSSNRIDLVITPQGMLE